MAVAEGKDISPPAPAGNQEEMAASHSHTNTPRPIEGDMGDDRSRHLETNATKRQSTHPVIEEQASIPGPIDLFIHDEPKEVNTDFLLRIHGLYRLLDLINEQGSGGAGMISSMMLHR